MMRKINTKVPIRLSSSLFGRATKSTRASSNEKEKINNGNIVQDMDVFKAPTVNPSIMLKYKEMSSTWWVKKSPISLVYELNKLRIPWIVDTLTVPNAVSPNARGLKKPLEGLDILDAGCGGGYLTESLTEFGCNIVGIDPCPELIYVAKEHLQKNSKALNVTYLCETIENHSKSQHEKYNAIIASQVLPFVEKPDLFIEKCIECLKPGGSIFITTFNKTVVSYIKYRIISFICGIDNLTSYQKLISKDQVIKCLTQGNCTVQSIRGFDYIPILRVWKWRKYESLGFAINARKD